jgi:hypothetical protein
MGSPTIREKFQRALKEHIESLPHGGVKSLAANVGVERQSLHGWSKGQYFPEPTKLEGLLRNSDLGLSPEDRSAIMEESRARESRQLLLPFVVELPECELVLRIQPATADKDTLAVITLRRRRAS